MAADVPSGTGAAFAARLSGPLQAHFAAALAQRASRHTGRARTLLEARLAALEQADASAPTAASASRGDDTPVTTAHPGLEALKALAAQHQQLAPAAGPSAAPPADPRPELKSLRYFRSTWTRLAAERRLAQSLAAQPDNAGPLNSQRLVHRALTLMQETSPEYLHHFMGYVETLMRLEPAPAVASAPAAAREGARARGGRKPRRDQGA